jgi:hypothetical protein
VQSEPKLLRAVVAIGPGGLPCSRHEQKVL